jgi:excisionase family DNA binding protein
LLTSSSGPDRDVSPGDSLGYCSVSEAAAKLGVSRISVWRWIRDGELPAIRVGQRITRIAQEDLDSILVTLRPSGRLPRDGHRHSEQAEAFEGLGSCEHLVQFYERDQALVEAVVRFIGDGLNADGSAIVVATRRHRASIQRALRAAGVDLQQPRRSGRYQALDALATLSSFMVDGLPNPGRFRDAIGGLLDRLQTAGQPVRIFGEMVALLALEGNEQATIELEELWNELQTARRFQLFCAYPMKALADESLGNLVQRVWAAHTRATPAESFPRCTSEQERVRAVVGLQHRIAALEQEVARRKQAEQQLRRALEQERTRTASSFASGGAHDQR